MHNVMNTSRSLTKNAHTSSYNYVRVILNATPYTRSDVDTAIKLATLVDFTVKIARELIDVQAPLPPTAENS